MMPTFYKCSTLYCESTKNCIEQQSAKDYSLLGHELNVIFLFYILHIYSLNQVAAFSVTYMMSCK